MPNRAFSQRMMVVHALGSIIPMLITFASIIIMGIYNPAWLLLLSVWAWLFWKGWNAYAEFYFANKRLKEVEDRIVAEAQRLMDVQGWLPDDMLAWLLAHDFPIPTKKDIIIK